MKIEIKNLHKRFGKLPVLDGIQLDVEGNKIIAILGPNGSGKTTLIKCILGMVIPNSGDITIDQKSVLGQWAYRNDIAYMPQIADFPQNLSVAELIRMIKGLRKGPVKDKELVEMFDIQPFYHKKLGQLSGGMRQKVNIVLTFMFDTPFMIFDEPTTGLDPVALIQLKELIRKAKQAGKTILITSHIMSFVEEISDEIVFILEGKIYFNGSVEILKSQTNQDNLEGAIAQLIKEDHV